MNTNQHNQGNDRKQNTVNERKQSIDMDTLLNRIKNEDSRNLRMTRNFKWFLYAMVIVYALLMVVNPDSELKWNHRLSGLCYVTAFAWFAVLFRKYNKEFSEIDYSVTVAEMFEKAAIRYRFNILRMLQVLPPLALIDAGLTISGYTNLLHVEFTTRILIVQVIFIPIMILAGVAGYLTWRVRQKPLRDKALEILKELNEP